MRRGAERGFGRLQHWLQELRQLAEDARQQRLAEIEAQSPLAAARLRRLLQDSEPAGDRIEPIAAAAPVHAADPAAGSASHRPAQLGPYRVERVLGRDAQWPVWLGHHLDTGQLVALRACDMAAHDAAERARLQRGLSALREQPRLASAVAVVDAGVDAEGRAWLATEFVPGSALLDYCDERGLDLRARMRLFLQLCACLLQARARGLTVAAPTLAAVRVDDRGQLVLTGSGDPLLRAVAGADATAPDDADSEKDARALGRLLYTLITGLQPRSTKGETAGSVVLASQRMARTRLQRAEAIAQARACSAFALRRQLRGELDALLLQAEQGTGPRSCTEWGAEVQRWLDGRPLRACPDTPGYRIRCWIRRQQRWSIAVALSIALLVLWMLR